ncbi:MAG: peptide chain release factor N(5)-glutamine methyltransferase [Elusimicrobia bacterium]|nr:peptide chain release factor N(5)-glutamine methyltransferase [Elusimicrobiota bacterium]
MFLVQAVLDFPLATPSLPPVIFDIGTGSGCIAIALARSLPNSIVYATDISQKALKVAKQNAFLHGVFDRIRFLHGDLFQPLTTHYSLLTTDLIVSNPPYIPAGRSLPPEVLKEPRIAWNGGWKGCQIVERMVRESWDRLKPGGWLALEMDCTHGLWISALMKRLGYREIQVLKDWSGLDRVALARK